MRWEQTGSESKLFWRKKTRKIYENAIETCFLLKNYEKAFYFFEKSRAVLLNDKLNESGAKTSLSAVDKAQEVKLQSKVDELRKSLSSKNTNAEKVEKELFLAENEQEKFIKTLETKNPAYFQLKYDTTTFHLKKIQQYLSSPSGGQGALIEYFVGDSATYSIVVSPTSVSLQKHNFDAKTAQQFLNICSENIATKAQQNEFLNLSTQLYKSLIQPQKLPKGQLIISQDGAFLPFEAFTKSAKMGDFLLKDYAISYTYSAQFLLKSNVVSNANPLKNFLGFAPVNYAKSLNISNLTGADESLKRVASNFYFSKNLLNKEATKANFINQAADYSIIQLFTHADADSADKEPVIYFADSVLRVSELNGFDKFKTQLLVLSACKTGVGKAAKGEGILSLARGFATLGIPATLTTLWSVENQATYDLTELFYKYLGKGLPKDIALQQAKIEYLSTHSGEKQDPKFWAAAVLVGDASAIKTSNLIYYISAVTLLLIFSFFIWYKVRKSNS
jgi:CHAT domain-containing protein